MLLFATLNDEKVVDCLREGTEVSMEFVEVSFAHIDDQLQKKHTNINLTRSAIRKSAICI